MADWLQQEMNRRYHEVSQLFPLMQGEEFEQLKADIDANGLREAIWLHPDGSIIDGRNRHRACIETEIRPKFRTWNGSGSLVGFVVSMNLHRRHLNESQRAMVAAKIADMPAHRPEKSRSIDLLSQDDAAYQLNVSVPSLKRAKQVMEQGTPELQEAVEQGDIAVSLAANVAKNLPEDRQNEFVALVHSGMTAPQAKRELTRQEKQAPPPLPPNQYRVIYADPPWSYDNSGFDQSAASQYPTMTVDEICDLPVDERAADESVLFLWATSPLLPEALLVMESWGFEYKASRVWIKDRAPGMGWFGKTRHELLLIGVRGQGHPLEKLDSVIEAPVTRHSAKPPIVYEDIERCYKGPYIELFARIEREGWESWGNEV